MRHREPPERKCQCIASGSGWCAALITRHLRSSESRRVAQRGVEVRTRPRFIVSARRKPQHPMRRGTCWTYETHRAFPRPVHRCAHSLSPLAFVHTVQSFRCFMSLSHSVSIHLTCPRTLERNTYTGIGLLSPRRCRCSSLMSSDAETKIPDISRPRLSRRSSASARRSYK